jgi:hypothetical protein
MIAGNVVDLDEATGAAQQFLHDRVVARRPVDASAQRPEINDIPEKEDRPALVLLQKSEKAPGLASTRSEMNV